MYLVVIAWLYVTVMMAVAEATSSTGSVLGAIFTFLLYGALPLSIVVYILGTPGRKRALRAQQIAEQEAEPNIAPAATPQTTSGLTTPDASGHTTTAAQGDSIAPVRKEP
jgi:membrane protein implicated in regulation of membrane protease activity